MYVMRHNSSAALKIGIRNLTSQRLQDHQRHGWTLVEEWSFADGTRPPHMEGLVLDWCHSELGLAIACKPGEMPQGGYTETATLDDVTEQGTKAYISMTLPCP